MALALPVRAFRQQLGPFALVCRPPDPVMQQLALQLAAGRTGEHRRSSGKPVDTALAFDELVVMTLPPVGERATFTVGRLPDCDVVVDHPSVSKRHAELSWDEAIRRCAVRDLGSRNGTLLNEGALDSGSFVVSDDDVLTFGDESFWFLLSETLRERLGPGPGQRNPRL